MVADRSDVWSCPRCVNQDCESMKERKSALSMKWSDMYNVNVSLQDIATAKETL